MRNVLHLEQRLRNLTSSGPDLTEGRLTPVTIRELEVVLMTHDKRKFVFLSQENYGFLNWGSFLQRAFHIIEYELDPDVVVLIDEKYLKVY